MDSYLKIISFVLIGFIASSCGQEGEKGVFGTDIIENPISADGEKGVDDMPKIEFEETEYSTGRIAQGEKVYFTYKFRNTGKAPLVISDVFGSCGCTVPKTYPRDRIPPGEGGEIEVEFDSKDKWGEQTVSITVVTNTLPSVTQLIVRTDIVVPDNMKTK